MSRQLVALSRDGETPRQVLLRWGCATMCVATLHVGTVYAVVNWPRPPEPAGEPPAAVMIELAPIPVAPDAPEMDVAVGPQQEMTEESTPTEAKDEPDETPKDPVEPVKTEPPPEPVQDPIEPVVEPEPDLPELPKMEVAEAVLPPRAMAPVEPEKPEEPEKPDEVKAKEEPKEVEKKKSTPKPKSVAQAASAPKPMKSARAKVNAAPSSGTASAASISSWRGSVVAHLNRHKRYPGGGARGTSSVAFTINRSGGVIAARLIRSSGNKTLDQEAVALARRASPVPKPPANIAGGSIVLTVPIRFSR
ncbi:energy transducer TonB [Hyphomicrobium sp. NDB2Meth4]|uniref:energy transducer TonB family protein n=1 Tax=Hyphomicrobium sp. NDB2Meth4 TaxID=1892846 RepID=UPI000931D722|nr:energy transducer TonB [Hyphomicrobium sp. NDB2Meth4]